MYLSGIEICKACVWVSFGLPPNCTLVELKSLNNSCHTGTYLAPNCTLVELKLRVKVFCVIITFCVSKLYLSGIEIIHETAEEEFAQISKLYLSGIEICSPLVVLYDAPPPNCTLVELKFVMQEDRTTKSSFSKLYLSGIEMVYHLRP